MQPRQRAPGAGRKPTTGRGTAGRYVVGVAFGPDEIIDIDNARGDVTRAAWVRDAALRAARRRRT